MRRIRLICLGRTKERFLQQGLDTYIKRLTRYCKFEWVELKESNAATPSLVMAAEAEKVREKLDPSAFWIVLDEKGKQLSSEDLAGQFEMLALKGQSKIDFVIGGAWGIDPELKKDAHFLLSLSKMTFTHQMIRLFLVEQIYRAETILKGEKYHNP